MNTIPSDFLDDLQVKAPVKDRLVNACRWVYVGLLIYCVLTYSSLFIRPDWNNLDISRFSVVLITLLLVVTCLVQLLRRKASGWMLAVILAMVFTLYDVLILYRFTHHVLHTTYDIMATVLYIGLLLINILFLVVNLPQRGLAFYQVSPKTRMVTSCIGIVMALLTSFMLFGLKLLNP